MASAKAKAKAKANEEVGRKKEGWARTETETAAHSFEMMTSPQCG